MIERNNNHDEKFETLKNMEHLNNLLLKMNYKNYSFVITNKSCSCKDNIEIYKYDDKESLIINLVENNIFDELDRVINYLNS
jgi:hypothetical protein